MHGGYQIMKWAGIESIGPELHPEQKIIVKLNRSSEIQPPEVGEISENPMFPKIVVREIRILAQKLSQIPKTLQCAL